MALDTGTAIKGEVRADLYLGTGAAAGVEAGRVKHRLRLYALTPVLDPAYASR
jgi:membrane-bound lytic murein transglycosylase A